MLTLEVSMKPAAPKTDAQWVDVFTAQANRRLAKPCKDQRRFLKLAAQFALALEANSGVTDGGTQQRLD
jgi:hypothetical protein